MTLPSTSPPTTASSTWWGTSQHSVSVPSSFARPERGRGRDPRALGVEARRARRARAGSSACPRRGRRRACGSRAGLAGLEQALQDAVLDVVGDVLALEDPDDDGVGPGLARRSAVVAVTRIRRVSLGAGVLGALTRRRSILPSRRTRVERDRASRHGGTAGGTSAERFARTRTVQVPSRRLPRSSVARTRPLARGTTVTASCGPTRRTRTLPMRRAPARRERARSRRAATACCAGGGGARTGTSCAASSAVGRGAGCGRRTGEA